MPLSPRKGKRPMPFSRTKAAEAWTAAPSHSPAPSRPSSSLSTLIKRIQGIEKNEGRSDRETCLPDSCSQPSQHSARYGSSGTVPPHDCATVKQQGALGNDRDESHGPTKTFQTKQTASAIEHKKSAQTQSHSRSQERPESSLWRFAQDSPSANSRRSTDARLHPADTFSKENNLSNHGFHVHGERVPSASSISSRQTSFKNVRMMPGHIRDDSNRFAPAIHSQYPWYPWMEELECHHSSQHDGASPCARCAARQLAYRMLKSSSRRVGGGYVLLEKMMHGGGGPSGSVRSLPAVVVHASSNNPMMQQKAESQEMNNSDHLTARSNVSNSTEAGFATGSPRRQVRDESLPMVGGIARSELGSETVHQTTGTAAMGGGLNGELEAGKPLPEHGDQSRNESLPTLQRLNGQPGTSTVGAWTEQRSSVGKDVKDEDSTWEPHGQSMVNAGNSELGGLSGGMAGAAHRADGDMRDQADQFAARSRDKRRRKKKVHKTQKAGQRPTETDAGADIEETVAEDPAEMTEAASKSGIPISEAGAGGSERRIQRRSPRRKIIEIVDDSSESSSEDIANNLDAHKKYSILGEEKRARYKQVFQDIDINGDGSLSITELEASLASVNKGWGSVDGGSEERLFVETLLSVSSEAVDDGLDFKTFCIILALSEQAEGLELLLESNAQKMGPKALYSKVEKAKDLFQMLEPDLYGNVNFDQLEVALHAGNIPPDLIHSVSLSLKASAATYGEGEHISFMDVLQYLPLFAEAHREAREASSLFGITMAKTSAKSLAFKTHR